MKRALSASEASALRSLLADTYVATGQAILDTGNAAPFIESAVAFRKGEPVSVDSDKLLDDLHRLSALINELEARRDDLVRLGKNQHGRDALARAADKSVTWVRQRLAVDPRIADLREENLTRDGSRWRVRRSTPIGA